MIPLFEAKIVALDTGETLRDWHELRFDGFEPGDATGRKRCFDSVLFYTETIEPKREVCGVEVIFNVNGSERKRVSDSMLHIFPGQLFKAGYRLEFCG